MLGENRRPKAWLAVGAWAVPLTALTAATDWIGKTLGGFGVAVIWTAALMALVGAAVILRHRVRSRPRVLLFDGEGMSVLDRAGREIARDKPEHLHVERGHHHVGVAGHGWQPALAVTIAGLGTLSIGSYGVRHTWETPAGIRTPRYLVGPDQWQALVTRLGVETP